MTFWMSPGGEIAQPKGIPQFSRILDLSPGEIHNVIFLPRRNHIMLEFSPGEFQHCMNSPGEKYEILDFSLTWRTSCKRTCPWVGRSCLACACQWLGSAAAKCACHWLGSSAAKMRQALPMASIQYAEFSIVKFNVSPMFDFPPGEIMKSKICPWGNRTS